MIELFEKLNSKAKEIANMRVAEVVEDMDQLTVALCAGNLGEIARTVRATHLSESQQEAAYKAYSLGTNPTEFEAAARQGFFAKGLRDLLVTAEKNPDAGSRLFPIFNELVLEYKKYRIPKKLKARVKNYMSEKKRADGFALTLFDDVAGRVVIHAADWVSDALFDEDD